MKIDKEQAGGLDWFRLVAALLVVAIHTSPLSSWSDTADFIFTRVIARVAVPFFLMVTGFFLTPRVGRQMKKLLLLYGAAILVYLPVNFYAGHFENAGLWDILRMLLFDGTMYHLWYFPAVLLGLLLASTLCKRLPLGTALAVSAGLYVLGLLGDSYYGFVSGVPAVSAAYAACFRVSSYTRNGLFFAPLFLVLGVWMRGQGRQKWCLLGFLLSLAAMIGEGVLLHGLGVQRHDSMYLMLPVCMVFLFRLLLSWRVRPRPWLREASMWIYLMHPMMLLAVRFVSKTLRLDNSAIRYLLVCAASCAFACLACWLHSRLGKKNCPTGRAWIELDMNNLRHNVQALRAMLPQGCTLMPVLKANAYGHGAVPMAKQLHQLGMRSFCVATAGEGAALRRHGIRGEILVLGYTHPAEFSLLRRYRLTQTVVDADYADLLHRDGRRFRVHVAIDTGMHRIGERCENFDEILHICQMKNLTVTGLFTHLCAEDSDEAACQVFTSRQAEQFARVRQQLRAHGYAPKAHLLSSYGLLKCPVYGGDYARVGIALYGVLCTGDDAGFADLRPVLSLKARVASVRGLHPGESAGYGLAFTAQRETRLATLTIGYADGLPRALSCGTGHVLLHGRRAPIISLICMDQTLVDVTDIPEVRPGDAAVLIGASGNDCITAYELAAQAGTITNEILSGLGQRLAVLPLPCGSVDIAPEKFGHRRKHAVGAHEPPKLCAPGIL